MKKAIIGLTVLALVILAGYVSNLVRVFSCDFSAPYKCEAVRIAGVVFPPAGVVLGFINVGK